MKKDFGSKYNMIEKQSPEKQLQSFWKRKAYVPWVHGTSIYYAALLLFAK